MKAVVIHEHSGPEVLKYEDHEMPQPGAQEILMEVRATSISEAMKGHEAIESRDVFGKVVLRPWEGD
jgi:D-arabinose 1-dehydrogenase-like Zn-dependent alcohol dehydrogenase